MHYTDRSRFAERNPNWKGGQSLDGGYLLRYVPGHPRARHGRYVAEHTLVAEAALGKPLPPRAVVHHIDENKTNNAPSNLVICENQAYHRLLHYRQRIVQRGGTPGEEKICSSCGALWPLSCFARNKNTIDGRCNRCLGCNKVYKRGRAR